MHCCFILLKHNHVYATNMCDFFLMFLVSSFPSFSHCFYSLLRMYLHFLYMTQVPEKINPNHIKNRRQEKWVSFLYQKPDFSPNMTWKSSGASVVHRCCLLEIQSCVVIGCQHWFSTSFVQVEPNSIAAKDGRIKEGDRILQVGIFMSVPEVHEQQVMLWTDSVSVRKYSSQLHHWQHVILISAVQPNKTNKKKENSNALFFYV